MNKTRTTAYAAAVVVAFTAAVSPSSSEEFSSGGEKVLAAVSGKKDREFEGTNQFVVLDSGSQTESVAVTDLQIGPNEVSSLNENVSNARNPRRNIRWRARSTTGVTESSRIEIAPAEADGQKREQKQVSVLTVDPSIVDSHHPEKPVSEKLLILETGPVIPESRKKAANEIPVDSTRAVAEETASPITVSPLPSAEPVIPDDSSEVSEDPIGSTGTEKVDAPLNDAPSPKIRQEPNLPLGPEATPRYEYDENGVALMTDADGGDGSHSWAPPSPASGDDGEPYAHSESARVPTSNDGYFPTQNDTLYIGDLDYRRMSYGSAPYAPDLYSQNYTGIFHYQNPDPTFFSRNDAFFGPLDRALGVISPHDALVWESARPQHLAFGADGGFPFFTPHFNPDHAHIKAGPLFLDFLSAGGGVLYSDYNGQRDWPEGEDPGWLGYIDLEMRAALRISDTFFVTLDTHLMYLPKTNRVAFWPGRGQRPALSLYADYQDELGAWDVRLYNFFRVLSTYDILGDLVSGALDRSGRYIFGWNDFYNIRNSRFFDSDSFFPINTVGGSASRLLNRDWRITANAHRSDYWRNLDFENHRHLHHLGAILGYEGSRIPFAPFVRYSADTSDGFDSLYQRSYVGGRGRLSENVSLFADGGYLWTTGRRPNTESWLWNVRLKHDLSERTHHSLWYGQDFFTNSFTPDTVLAEYTSYRLNHRISRELYGGFHAQWGDEELLERDGLRRKRDFYGLYLDYRPFDYTSIRADARYQNTRPSDGRAFDEEERWIYGGMITQRIYSRTTLWFRYQFEDNSTYDEHLYMTGLRRYF